MNQEKQRPARVVRPSGGARSGPFDGALAAGRQAEALGWSAKLRSEHALAHLGLGTALDEANRLLASGNARAAERIRQWLNLDPRTIARLVGSPTRQLRLSLCGVAFVIRRNGEVGYMRRGCKDRVCPVCSARRSRMIAARLRDHVATLVRRARLKSRAGERWPAPENSVRVDGRDVAVCLPQVAPVWSFTFTRPRRAGEAPREAIDAVLNSWRGFVERHGKGLFVGGMRSLEVTARRAGDTFMQADGSIYTVKYPGTHAHLHCLLELAEGVTPTEVVEAWLASCPGAESWCQRPRPVTEGAIYQACKYPVDMSGLLDVVDGAPGYVEAVLRALRGRRVVATIGTWRGLKLAGEDGDGSVVFGDRAVVTLATSTPEDDDVVTWGDGDTTPAVDVLRALLDSAERERERHRVVRADDLVDELLDSVAPVRTHSDANEER